MRSVSKVVLLALVALGAVGFVATGGVHRWFPGTVTKAPVAASEPPPEALAAAGAAAASVTSEPAPATASPATEPDPPPPPRDALDEFTSAVLAEAEDTWTKIFAEESDTYIPPRLRYFDGTVRSGCGNAVDSDGTFYCAPDRRLYIDKDFHRGMIDRGAPPGSLAHGYVLAHSIGHHVQNLRGVEDRLRREQAGKGKRERQALQTRYELQADCYAGIWAHGARKGRTAFTAAELDQALSLPASIGIELVRRHEPGVIVPDPYSQGTLPQRKRWFMAGYKHGLVKDCDSFAARRL